jgi:hypothetical protein
MNKYYIIVLIIITGFTTNDVRKEIVVIDWKTATEHENKLGYSFTNAGYEFPGSNIPLFFKIIPVESASTDFNFILENPVFEDIGLSHDYLTPENFPTAPVIKKTRLSSAGNHTIEIQIPAVIQKDNQVLLLKKFDLKQIPIKTKSAVATKYVWKNESVLREGKWVKINTEEKGLYRIPYSRLLSWGFTNPAKVNIYGAGGMILPEDPGNILYDDLPQITAWHGKNNGTDCLFFYSPGSIEWKTDPSGRFFERHLHNYTTKGSFFLSESGNPAVMELLPEAAEEPTHTITYFDEYLLHETEITNLLQSGKQWFGEKFTNGTSRNFTFPVTDAENSSDISFRIRTAARSSAVSMMQVTANQSSIGRIDFSIINTSSDSYGNFADERTSIMSMPASSGNLNLTLRYSGSGSNPEAWLDYIEVNYRRKLKVSNQPLFFRNIQSTGMGNILEFAIETTAPGIKVLDVTNLFNIKEVPLKQGSNTATGKQSSATLREYVAFNPNGTFREPELVGEIENQNLHAIPTPEFLIITHQNFIKQANQLADFHRTYDGMQVEVVPAGKIYNEFSSGNKDATGIRNFIKMLYDRKQGLKYVLLFGDGSYDNRNIKTGSLSFIPTFQSDNSLSPVSSFLTDDYFVMLDAGESVYSGAIDLGIGRIPSSTAFQADIVLKKIRDYHSQAALGNWRNTLCFIADDGDGNMHMNDTEEITNEVNKQHPEFLIDKIYFDAFTKITGPGGASYPEVTSAINQSVRDGALILNYIGHANNRFIADERVLDISHINSWSNSNNLFIFVTATCELSRFDADETSAGEYVLFNPNGGGIGLFSTTRVVFAYSNKLLSKSFYNHVIKKDAKGEYHRMGDIMRLAKINTINTINKRNFSLLANPAMKLSYPKHKIVTSAINGNSVTETPDTLGALKKVTITGFVADKNDNIISNFSGKIIPVVYDKASMQRTRGNDGATPMQFKVQENIIFKGLAEVKNGEFTFSFVIPKDISYKSGLGKIVYYADNGETDAHGIFENFIIGGPASQIADNNGPEIKLFLDSPDFKSGDKVSRNPTLLAYLSDENGINMVGSGIGHDITAVLNNDYSHVMILNKYYQSEIGDFTRGTVRFPMQNLPAGKHILTLKAWDVANNSSEATVEFEVTSDFFISNISNYPNPVQNFTFFKFEHNQSDAVFETVFEVFDQLGQRVDYFTTTVSSYGTMSNPVRWDLSEAKLTLRSGVYFYRVTAQSSDGLIASKTGKMIVTR